MLLFQAELYRVEKQFDKAEPLYLEAINILEESFGTEDVRYDLFVYEDKECLVSWMPCEWHKCLNAFLFIWFLSNGYSYLMDTIKI